jgi:hypothetical protein
MAAMFGKNIRAAACSRGASGALCFGDFEKFRDNEDFSIV